mgnify:CR=1 FL=1
MGLVGTANEVVIHMNPVEEGKLIATVEQLSTAVTKLIGVVERLESRQNYQAGALAAIGVICAAIGGIAATMLQWFHK